VRGQREGRGSEEGRRVSEDGRDGRGCKSCMRRNGDLVGMN